MSNKPGNDVHLVAWSGGLDSTWLVWELCRQGVTTCADHYHQVGGSERKRRLVSAQQAAVSIIAPKLELCGLTVRTVHPLEKDSPHDIVWCTEIVIDDAIHGLHAWPSSFYLAVRTDETSNAQLIRQAAARDLWEEFAPSWSQIVVPACGLTRKEMWDQLPEEIRRHTWSCRNPKMLSGSCAPCQRCKPCKELAAAGVPIAREVTVE